MYFKVHGKKVKEKDKELYFIIMEICSKASGEMEKRMDLDYKRNIPLRYKFQENGEMIFKFLQLKWSTRINMYTKDNIKMVKKQERENTIFTMELNFKVYFLMMIAMKDPSILVTIQSIMAKSIKH